MTKCLITFILIIPSLLIGKIIETESFEEILTHVSPNTIVLCDLDNTLIESIQQFGSVQWGDQYKRKLIKNGETPEKADDIVHNLWFKMLPNIPMRLVDTEAPKIIQRMQNACIVLGLTARHAQEAQLTHSQLDQLGIQFNSWNPGIEPIHKDKALYEKGILFCGKHKKSTILLAFLKQLDKLPEKIIFVDDKMSHVQDLENSLAAFDIEYVGIRFSKVDKRVNEYDDAIAEIQAEFFPQFISDEAARKIMLFRKEI